jgi:16S rRNA (cytosine967-C5)-methyltransferase
MKPASRIQTTIDVLEKIVKSRIPMDSTVGDYMRVRRYIGAKDRADVAERVYHMTRAYARIGWWLSQLGLEDTPRHRVIVWLALGEGIELKRYKDLFDDSKYAPASLTEDEQAAAEKIAGQSLEHPDMPEHVLCECPPLYHDALKTYFGDVFADEMKAMQDGATLDMRVNTFLCTREKAQAFLSAAGVETFPTPYAETGLRARGKAFLSRTKAFAKGWVEIQDEGSQLIAQVCAAQPGMQVLDFCAGAGGKTLALAAAMNRKGRIVAMDLDEKRLEKGRLRYKKAQLADIIEVRPLSEDKQRKWLKRQKENFDLVLLDVPCTGTGTWRRNPDMRWETYGPGLEELRQIQAEIMDKVVHVLKPGGRLVYATCSLLAEENEQQVAAFLTRHPEFQIKPVDPTLKIGSPFMRLTPLRHKTDGFFAAVLEKAE